MKPTCTPPARATGTFTGTEQFSTLYSTGYAVDSGLAAVLAAVESRLEAGEGNNAKGPKTSTNCMTAAAA